MLGLRSAGQRVEGEDGQLHVLAHRDERYAVQFTRCGRFPISAPALPDIPACHICLPHLAHPLAAVWENCRRWDANYNAELHR